jgi:HAD superfamily hydrolase (TIGR01450 family)
VTERLVLCDLDGVVWLAHRPIPGAAEAIARLRAAGATVLFVTNNSGDTIARQEAALDGVGVPATGAVLTSAMAAAHLVQPGERVLVVGGPGIFEALVARGVVAVDAHEHDDPSGFDAVVAGIDRRFTYDVLRVASSAVRAGARLVGTNDDATFPTATGLIPGGGSLLAAIATASGARPVVAGKPYEPMAALVRDLYGPAAVDTAWMVGDRPDTDGRFARTLGCRFALVLSGVTIDAAAADPPGDLVAADLAAVATTLLTHG